MDTHMTQEMTLHHDVTCTKINDENIGFDFNMKQKNNIKKKITRSTPVASTITWDISNNAYFAAVMACRGLCWSPETVWLRSTLHLWHKIVPIRLTWHKSKKLFQSLLQYHRIEKIDNNKDDVLLWLLIGARKESICSYGAGACMRWGWLISKQKCCPHFKQQTWQGSRHSAM